LSTGATGPSDFPPPVIPNLPRLKEAKLSAHVKLLSPEHPIGIPTAAVTARPHVYWLLGTIGFALFVKCSVHKSKGPKFQPGHETAGQKTERLDKLRQALARVDAFEQWVTSQQADKATAYARPELDDALELSHAVRSELLDSQSVDVVLDNGRKRLPLVWNLGAGMGVNLFDFLFLLPLLPLGVAQWAYRATEDALFPPRLWTSETSLALLGEQVRDQHVLMPAAVQPSWWQRQNYYRQRAGRVRRFSGKHIDPAEYQALWLFAPDVDAPAHGGGGHHHAAGNAH